ncbi:DUF6220 domain-containing protein [Vacuolonema iberomarrocanum]|uniref:DUF6220 domain-containing protein n=1 Tax=Vacuolonema iberomarrocanum TaxID=3454632 RepID=UPI003F6DD63F
MHMTSNPSDSTTNQIPNSTQSPHWAVIGFCVVAILFNLCLVAQLLTVGFAHFYNPAWWNIHVHFVRGYSGLSLILLAWVYWIPFPPRIRKLTASLAVLLGLQFLTIHAKTSLPLAIFHPLLGFSLFTASSTLVHRVWRTIWPSKENKLDTI